MRREKIPNLLPVLEVAAEAGIVLDFLASRSFISSGVVPRFSALDVAGIDDTGIGEGFREEALTGTTVRDLETEKDPNLESDELVRL